MVPILVSFVRKFLTKRLFSTHVSSFRSTDKFFLILFYVGKTVLGKIHLSIYAFYVSFARTLLPKLGTIESEVWGAGQESVSDATP